MKLDSVVGEFRDRLLEKDLEEEKVEYYAACFEACIPKDFWNKGSKDVKRNKKAFERVVLVYVKKWRTALKYGYGLLFTGDNGTGKSLFMSFILTQMVKRGVSVYYTSLAQLDVDIKSTFNDPERARRLDQQLDCDFLSIDEMGKEHVKDNSYLRARLELLLKTRFDNADPTLIATNLSLDDLEEHYGSSIASMLRGRYQVVPLICPDYRSKVAARMTKRMGFR